MKIKKLYIKIFLSFIFLLVVSEILIFGVFKALFEKQTNIEANHQLKKYFIESVSLFREGVEEKIHSRPGVPLGKNSDLRMFIDKISNKYDLAVWIEVPGIEPVNFSKMEIPDISDENLINSGNFFYKIHFGKKGSIYLKIPFEIRPGLSGFIYVNHRKEPVFHRIPFIKGLVIIGICIALLVYPFSRFITQPLKKLTRSANNIAEGDLSQRVFIRTKDEIGRLAESFNKMAVKIENMIKGTKEMTANISHELRSPLARMRIAEEMLAEKIRSGDLDIKKYLSSIENEIREMDLLLGQVLDLTKLNIDEGRKKGNTDIVEILTEIISSFSTVLEKKSIDVITKIAKESLIINAVKEDAKTIFRNIIDNAAKYTKENGKITIEADRSGNSINVTVSNTCKNLKEDDLLNIARPFYRSSIVNNIPGYGLGLSITKKILDNYKGTIVFQNIDEGFAVNITLPFHET